MFVACRVSRVVLAGRGFSPLDVLGLASVGLSTKGAAAGDDKKSIGFMGGV